MSNEDGVEDLSGVGGYLTKPRLRKANAFLTPKTCCQGLFPVVKHFQQMFSCYTTALTGFAFMVVKSISVTLAKRKHYIY